MVMMIQKLIALKKQNVLASEQIKFERYKRLMLIEKQRNFKTELDRLVTNLPPYRTFFVEEIE